MGGTLKCATLQVDLKQAGKRPKDAARARCWPPESLLPQRLARPVRPDVRAARRPAGVSEGLCSHQNKDPEGPSSGIRGPAAPVRARGLQASRLVGVSGARAQRWPQGRLPGQRSTCRVPQSQPWPRSLPPPPPSRHSLSHVRTHFPRICKISELGISVLFVFFELSLSSEQ